MSTVLTKIKTKFSKKLTPLKTSKSYIFNDQYLQQLFSSENTKEIKEIESSLNTKDLLELKKRIIIYRIKQLRNQSALRIQKMWNKYINKIKIHKLSHHLTGCYTIYLASKGMTKAFIKIFCDEENKEIFKIQKLRFCPIRNCFVCDIPKNKFYTKRKVMHFIFLNRNKEPFYDDNYEKVFFFNEYVHKVDFSFIDKNQKLTEETLKKEKEKNKIKDIFNTSTEDEKDYSDNYTLTPSPNKSMKFKFESNNKEINENEEDEYSGLRRAEKISNNEGIRRGKRYESFDVSYTIKTKLKSILKDSNPEERKKRRSIKESVKKVTFGKTETLCFK